MIRFNFLGGLLKLLALFYTVACIAFSTQNVAASGVDVNSFTGNWFGLASSTFSHWETLKGSCKDQQTSLSIYLKSGRLIVFGDNGCATSLNGDSNIAISARISDINMMGNKISFVYENVTFDVWHKRAFSAEIINGIMSVNFTDESSNLSSNSHNGYDNRMVTFNAPRFERK